MSDAQTAALQRLDGLLGKGDAVLTTYRPGRTTRERSGRFGSPITSIKFPSIDAGSVAEFQAQSEAVLADLLGADSTYLANFQAAGVGGSLMEKTAVEKQLGVLRAVRDDVASGHALRTARKLLAAEIFDDLIGQAVHLLDAGYFVAAAAVSGSALEAGLRESAQHHGIRVSSSDDASALNQKHMQAGVYTLVRRKQVEVWIGIRNQADHGHVTQISGNDVAGMITGVRELLATLL